MARCRSCGADLIWAMTVAGGWMPVDAKPVPDGNVVLDYGKGPGHPPTARVMSKEDRERSSTQLDFAGEEKPLAYTSHFATCVNAAYHRRKRA